MARIRTVKPEFFTSLTVASLPVHARLTFIGLWTHVDDEGRCVDDARLIKAAVWPLDDRLAGDVEEDLKALTESSLITRYTVKGRSYLAVRGWTEHQRINRPTKSKLPPPPDDDSPPSPPALKSVTSENAGSTEPSNKAHAQLTESSSQERNREQGTGKGTGSSSAATAAKRGTRLPEDFTVTPEMVAWATERVPHVDGRSETEKFINYWRAKSGKDATKLDWQATWRNWMLNAAERAGRPPPNGTVATRNGNGAYASPAAERLARGEAIAQQFRDNPPHGAPR